MSYQNNSGILGSAKQSPFSSGPSGPAYTGGTMTYDEVLLAASGRSPTPSPAPAPSHSPPSPFSSGPSGPAYTGGTMTYDEVLRAASGNSSPSNAVDYGNTKPLYLGPAGQQGAGAGSGSGSRFSSGPSGPAYTGGTMTYDEVLQAAGGGKPPTSSPGVDIGYNKPLYVGPAGQQGSGAGSSSGSRFSSGPSGPSYSIGSSAGNTSRQIDYGTETIEGRIGNLLSVDANGNYTNPLIKQAANTAMQQFAGRGLLNSSMASEAAYQAAMSKAIEIAGPDAQTYFAQGRANQDASNVFERDARGYAQENARLDKQLSVDMDKFNQDLQYRYDALKLDKTSQDDARALAQKYAIEMENIKTVNSAYDLYLRRISDIDANTEYNAGTKMRLKNEAGKDFDLYAKAKGISQDMNLGNRFSAASDVTALPKPIADLAENPGLLPPGWPNHGGA